MTPEGYLYRTDEFGRIKHVETTELVLKKAKRKAYMQRVVGREFRKKDDDGGHLIASQFGGSGDLDNLVPMNSTLNRHGEWRKLEADWAKALKAEPPKKVQIKIEPVYSGDSLRPDKFVVNYKIGNEKYDTVIENKESIYETIN
ncbi:DNA/RNA non-specific endonuclease [Macrococcoides canis]|nr:DNA/RNA non-specific endonuclease [Macrococcus canis]